VTGAEGRSGSRWLVWVPWACLAIISAVGAGLRLGYFLNGDPFVDEWATRLVARGIVEQGLPFLPSGSFYGHGILFSYVDALSLSLFGWTPEVAQLPSLLAGLVTIPLAYWVGRRLFGPARPAPVGGSASSPVPDGASLHWRWRGEAVGLLAAALLAIDPVAIIWAGRARAYTLQQVFVLLATLWLFRRRYLLFALAFAAALFAHAEAALLLPGFALSLLLTEGWPVLRQVKVWLALVISVAAIVARFWLHRLILSGSGRQFQPVDSRPAFELTLDLLSSLEPLTPFFAEPHRLVITGLFVIGLVFALRAWRRRERSDGYLLLYPLVLVALAIMVTVVGQTWKEPRYLFMLLPAFFMLASAAAVDLWTVLFGARGVPVWLKAGGAVALAALLLVPALPEALDTTDKLEEGYGPTLAYVREHWQPGDQVAGWAVPAIAVELGQVDYFALQIRHEEFIMEKDGVWVDRWVGAPLMDSVEQLEAALAEPGRLWFLTDEFRFRARYTPEFAQAIWDDMEPVYRYHYALAFVERPAQEAAYGRDREASFEGGLDMLGYEVDPAVVQPGDTLTVVLRWQARDWVDAPYTTFVHLIGPDGQRVAQADGPPFDGLHPTDHWLPGERLRDTRHLAIPADAPRGRYQVVVGWYDPETGDRLPLSSGGDSLTVAYVPLGTSDIEMPATLVNARLADKVELVGYDLWREVDGSWTLLADGDPVAIGDRLRARLVWRALTELEHDYTVFVHLTGPGGEVWAQQDSQPAGLDDHANSTYPTSYWRAGDLIVDGHDLVVNDGAAGSGTLVAGMYILETMERLGEPVPLLWVGVNQ
jgi:hypothetical protein